MPSSEHSPTASGGEESTTGNSDQRTTTDRGHQRAEDTARQVVLSYPSELSTWGRDIVEDDPFHSYLPKAHDHAIPGDVWEEFVGVGCCGDALDVPLRVESVEGGQELTSETTFEFTVREACLAGGWEVQSEASPE